MGRCTVNRISDPRNTTPWFQGWLQVHVLGLDGGWNEEWLLFLSELRKAHVRLRDAKDEVVWVFNNSWGHFSTKIGYLAVQDSGLAEDSLWPSKIYKIKAPPKCMIFFGLVLKKRVLTWDRLQLRGNIGPGIYLLCRQDKETNDHLFLDCQFTKLVWSEVEVQVSKGSLWVMPSLEEYFQVFFVRSDLKEVRALPLLVAWSIWLARNANIFEECSLPSFRLSQ